MTGFLSLALRSPLASAKPSTTGPAPVDVIYGISPFYFSRDRHVVPLREIRRRLPEIKELGASVIWLQPVTLASGPGQAYDTIDHFAIAPEFGTEKDLKDLVQKAHDLKMKVLLDVALNHTSIKHPYAQDVIRKGSRSKHFHFYQSAPIPDIPYSEFFNTRKDGKATFVYYFWKPLINLNYSHPEVRKYAISVLEHWVKNFDVDGYRLDASWGPQTRWPEFYSTVSRRLRALKKNVLLIAEDKAGFPARYEGTDQPHLKGTGFDAAYDWNAEDPNWLSKWSFQTGDSHGETVFNQPDPKMASKALAQAIRSGAERAEVPILRYLENNDTGSFLQSHTLEQTRFAAATVMLLPGIPLFFYGQEMGLSYPQWQFPSIDPQKKLKDHHPELWNFYRQLIALKRSSPAFNHGKLSRVRTDGKGRISYLLKAGSSQESVELDLSTGTVLINDQPLEIRLQSL